MGEEKQAKQAEEKETEEKTEPQLTKGLIFSFNDQNQMDFKLFGQLTESEYLSLMKFAEIQFQIAQQSLVSKNVQKRQEEANQ